MPKSPTRAEEPCFWAEKFSLFGTEEVAWKPLPTGLTKDATLYQRMLRDSAVMQSAAVVGIRARMQERGADGAVLAKASGLSPSQISRLLTGFVPMTLRHLAALSIGLGGGFGSEFLTSPLMPGGGNVKGIDS